MRASPQLAIYQSQVNDWLYRVGTGTGSVVGCGRRVLLAMMREIFHGRGRRMSIVESSKIA